MGNDATHTWDGTRVLPQIICICGFMVQGVDESNNAEVYRIHVEGGPGCPVSTAAQASDASD